MLASSPRLWENLSAKGLLDAITKSDLLHKTLPPFSQMHKARRRRGQRRADRGTLLNCAEAWSSRRISHATRKFLIVFQSLTSVSVREAQRTRNVRGRRLDLDSLDSKRTTVRVCAG